MKYSEILAATGLFKGIDATEFEAMLGCIGAEIRNVRKNEIILLAGDKPRQVGVVLAGQLHILREDYDGNRSLLAAVAPGEIFAEALCCAGVAASPVTVMADTDSSVMLLGFPRILQTCSKACPFHTRLIENMLKMVANKNLQLQGRMEIIGLKSIRAKVLGYLQTFVPKQGKNICIPFNREELADFLCVERSALSHELARMKQDGLLDYQRNRFTLK